MVRVLKPVELIVVASEKGRVTVKYPYQEPLVTSDFRGAIRIDASKCIGCGACVKACPPNALELLESPERLVIRYFVGRCIFCWRCVDVCPVKAVVGTREFELATDRVEDLFNYTVHRRAECRECGSGFATRRMVEYVTEKSAVSEYYANECPECRKAKILNAVARRRGGV
ncbi:Membrane-bound hydrogenase, subunit NuoI [Thermogladius calderae 1633]|uniref:Membrane-bound hydrogenase, subunit NuoI n=1 Tax=Thermogladius calderae (strain DSM 22663 / VKM B-2946 / 1633) TaxID=1184251 RepID=I3TF84_THEC1|nr:4Fe-4S dicluster domain-containing protein [Thermogladius calderae]AFK51422.1 Membrane-bound hydrogenase, subunit NuoI [Thermogladius calderae 1633]